jgi:LuxR family transcriptional regulator, maltose regulon positive regulatory protein
MELLRHPGKLATGETNDEAITGSEAMTTTSALAVLTQHSSQPGAAVQALANLECDELAFDSTMELDATRDWQIDRLHLTQPVTIRTLGRFAVHINGVQLTFGRKVQKKPMELLKVLAAYPAVHETRLSEMLWPDADGDLAARALNTTLYRLRKLIGAAALQRRDGMVSLNAQHCYVDVQRLETVMTELAVLCRTMDSCPTQLDALTRELLLLSSGGFLQYDHNSIWALPIRERLRGKLLRHLSLAADAVQRHRQFDLAIASYNRTLQLDPLAEHFCCALMQTYLRAGQRQQAILTYDRARRQLRMHLGVTPSPTMEALLRRARDGE